MFLGGIYSLNHTWKTCVVFILIMAQFFCVVVEEVKLGGVGPSVFKQPRQHMWIMRKLLRTLRLMVMVMLADV